MPDGSAILETVHYWSEVVTRSFWDSLLFFFETRLGAWKGIGIVLLGMGFTTLIVWIARNREALTEHLKSNIAIVLAGGVCTWLLVFFCFVIAEPFIAHQEVASRLSISSERERAAVVSRHSAELQKEEATKHPVRITVQGQCKLTAEQINPVRLPQSCPGSSPPTFRDRVMAVNAHLTEGDRNRFSNALSEFEQSLDQGREIFIKIRKISNEGSSLQHDGQDGTIAKTAKSHQKVLSDLAAEGWKYQKAFPTVRAKWDMFPEQIEYIFGDNPDNEPARSSSGWGTRTWRAQ